MKANFRPVSTLFLHIWFSFFLFSKRRWLSFHTLFLFSRRQRKRIVTNKLLYLRTKAFLFLKRKLSRQSTKTLNDQFNIWWYKCLWVVVVVEVVVVQDYIDVVPAKLPFGHRRVANKYLCRLMLPAFIWWVIVKAQGIMYSYLIKLKRNFHGLTKTTLLLISL